MISVGFDSGASDRYETISSADSTQSLSLIKSQTTTKISSDIFIPELNRTFK